MTETMIAWNPAEHSDQDNLTWSWLRAVEWGRWAIFLSQSVAPIFLLFFNWKSVVVGTVVVNLLWAGFVRYRFVSIKAAYLGAIIVRLKWVTCPLVATYLYLHGEKTGAAFALLWPILVFIVGAFPTTQIGKIQNMFMAKFGHERRI